MTAPVEPQTEAGKRLADADKHDWADFGDHRGDILAIEQEAAARVTAPSDELRRVDACINIVQQSLDSAIHERDANVLIHHPNEWVRAGIEAREHVIRLLTSYRAALATTGQREGECTHHRNYEPNCGRAADDAVHVQPGERMGPGQHVWRHDPKDALRGTVPPGRKAAQPEDTRIADPGGLPVPPHDLQPGVPCRVPGCPGPALTPEATAPDAEGLIR